MPLAQASAPASQVWLAQHCWPAAPHAAHDPPLQATDGAVHSAPGQQSWPAPPQLPQLLLPQTAPTVGHVEPLPVQMSLMQQPPELHALGAQHGWPGLPHCVQTPLLQTSLASHARPGQHAWPGAPHD